MTNANNQKLDYSPLTKLNQDNTHLNFTHTFSPTYESRQYYSLEPLSLNKITKDQQDGRPADTMLS